MKRRIVLILIILAIVGGLAGGLVWYLRRGGPNREYNAVGLAIQAQKYDKAILLAQDFRAKYPADWRGPYIHAQALYYQGKKEQAGQVETLLSGLLRQKLEPESEATVRLFYAETIAQQARELGDSTKIEDPQKLQNAIDILTYPGGESQVVVLERKGKYLVNKGDYYRTRAKGNPENARQAQVEYAAAAQSWFAAISRDVARHDQLAVDLIRLGAQRNLPEIITQVRGLVKEIDDLPPAVAAELLRVEAGKAGNRLSNEELMEVMDKVLAKAPENLEALIYRARLALNQNQLADAEKYINRLKAQAAQNDEVQWLESELLSRQDKYPEAEQILFKLKTRRPQNVFYLFGYGEATAMTGKKDLALSTWRQIANLIQAEVANKGEINPDIKGIYSSSMTNIIKYLAKAGLLEDALAEAEALYRFDPNDAAATELRVTYGLENSRFERVSQLLLEKLGSPDKAMALAVGQGIRSFREACIKRNRYNDALEFGKKWAAKQPQNPDALIFQGQAQANLGQLEEAVKTIRRAIELEPGLFPSHGVLVDVYNMYGRWEEALKVLDELAQKGGKAKLASLDLRGRLYAGWGLMDQAWDSYQQLIQALPTAGPEVNLRLGLDYAQMGMKSEALAAWARVPENSPEFMIAQLRRANSAEAPGEMVKALQGLWEKHPADRTLALNFLNALRKAGDNQRASEFFEQLTKDPSAAMLDQEIIFAGLNSWIAANAQAKAVDFLQGRLAGSPKVRPIIALLLSGDPLKVQELFGNSEPSLPEGIIALAAAVRNQQPELTKKWSEWCGRQSGLGVSELYQSLVGLLQVPPAGPAGKLDKTTLPAEYALPLIELEKSAAAGQNIRPAAAQFLLCLIAHEFRVTAWAQQTAAAALQADRNCSWAAGMLVSDPEKLKTVLSQVAPESSMGLLLQADQYRQDRKYAEAAGLYQKLADLYPELSQLRFQAGACQENGGQFAEALITYQACQQKNPNPYNANSMAYMMTLIAPDDSARLMEAAQLVNGAWANNPAALDTMGWIYYLQKDYRQASSLLRQAIKNFPSSPEVHYHLGMVERANKNPQFAEWHLRAAVAFGGQKEKENLLTAAEAQAVGRAREALNGN